MGKEHLELRSADALEHDEIMKFRKKLIGDRVVTILCFLILDIGFIAGTVACLALKQWGRSVLLIPSTLVFLFLSVVLLMDHDKKPKAIKNKEYMVSEGTVYKKSHGGSMRHPQGFLTVENKDGSRGRYKVIPSVFNKAKEGSSCLIIKYDNEESDPKRFTRDIVIWKSKDE